MALVPQANDAFCSMLGYTLDELMKLTIYVLTSPNCLGGLMKAMCDILTNSVSNKSVHNVQLLHRNGQRVSLDLDISAHGQQPLSTPPQMSIPPSHQRLSLAPTATPPGWHPTLLPSPRFPRPFTVLQYMGHAIVRRLHRSGDADGQHRGGLLD